MIENEPCRICGMPSCGGVDLLTATPHGYDDERLTVPLCADCQVRLSHLVAVWTEHQAELRGRNDELREKLKRGCRRTDGDF